MAYKLALRRVPDSIRKTAREQLEGAAEGLERPEDPVEAVHDARKRIKKSRALLRLARPAMRTRSFRSHNRELRDQGRALSGARDADVLVETLDDLARHNPRRIHKPHVAAVRKRLGERAQGAPPEHDMVSVAGNADQWPVDRADAGTLVRAQAEDEPTTENLHEWRKRVKDLWYQQKLLQRVWPDVMKALAGEAKALSKLLGSDHDLAVLAGELAPGDPLLPLIADRRAQLQSEAFALGSRVYAESPKAFRKRVRRYARAVA
jgi:CHAD domain-containing protein